MDRVRHFLFLLLVCAGAFPFSSCHHSSTPTTKRYPFTGRVVSIDGQDQTAVIDGNAVPGFMEAMAMSYKIKPAAELSQLAPGDSISADVVIVESDANAASEYWLENVKVTAHVSSPHGPGANRMPMPRENLAGILRASIRGNIPCDRLLLMSIFTAI
jgi:protein SCO1